MIKKFMSIFVPSLLALFMLVNNAYAKPEADGTFKVSKDVVDYPYE